MGVRGGLERAGLAALRRIDPEAAHGMALRALRLGLGHRAQPLRTDLLRVSLAGLDLPNPVGLAAGFDKDAVAVDALGQAGFGWIEVGAVTPLPQAGNPRPRLFRLPEDRAAINRFGFNNAGMEAVAGRLARRRPGPIVGVNLGANKESADRAGDFAAVLARLGPLVDFATVNVSSPNTAGLRDLQQGAALRALLDRVMEARAGLPRPIPLFVKIAPDLDHDALAEVVAATEAAGLSGIVATNTTTARDGLHGPRAREAGGLSGVPLFERSTRVLARLSVMTRLPLVGVGGIASVEDVWAKIAAGATAVQLYTALTYQGLSLADRLARAMESQARESAARGGEDHRGYLNRQVGVGRDRWL